MFKKKLIAFSLCLTLVGSLAACGKESKTTEPTPTTRVATPGDPDYVRPTPLPNKNPNAIAEIGSAAENHDSVSADCKVDFEDGKYEFALLNEADWSRDKDSKLSVADAFGSKALVVTRPNGHTPAVAIDLASLLGSNAEKAKKVSIDLGITDDSGLFSAASGTVLLVAQDSTGADVEIETKYSIYKSTAACKTILIDLGDASITNKSYLTLGGVEDGGTTKHNITIDNIIFYDGSGSALPVDSSAKFAVDGVGSYDWSNSTAAPIDEVLLFVGGDTGTGWWPQPVNSWSYTDAPEGNVNTWIDPAKDLDKMMKPGDVLTIYYSVYPPEDPEKKNEGWQSIPYIRCQNWVAKDEAGNEVDDQSGWAGGNFDLMCNGTESDYVFDDDGTPAASMGCNESFTICQFDYDLFKDVVAQAGGTADDWQTGIDFIGVADRSIKIKIKAVTIGKKAN